MFASTAGTGKSSPFFLNISIKEKKFHDIGACNQHYKTFFHQRWRGQKVRVFFTGKHSQPNLMFGSKVRAYPGRAGALVTKKKVGLYWHIYLMIKTFSLSLQYKPKKPSLIVAKKARAYPTFRCSSRIGSCPYHKSLPGTNALAYSASSSFKRKKVLSH